MKSRTKPAYTNHWKKICALRNLKANPWLKSTDVPGPLPQIVCHFLTSMNTKEN